MSGRRIGILLGQELAHPLVNEAHEPDRNGMKPALVAALRPESEDAALTVDGRHLIDKRDISLTVDAHITPFHGSIHRASGKRLCDSRQRNGSVSTLAALIDKPRRGVDGPSRLAQAA